MSEKTQLEREIERRELVKKPPGLLVLVAFLCVCIGALGVYTFKLKQELSIKEQEITLIKNNFDKEKELLINEIRKLGGRHEALESDPGLSTDSSRPVSVTEGSGEKVKKNDEE